MAEGLNPAEVGHEIGEHAKHHKHAHGDGKGKGHEFWLSIVEAVLLSLVTLAVAWSGYSAARFEGEASIDLADAAAGHTKASRAFQESLTLRVGDATTFNAWFGAYVSGDKDAIRIAEKRFRPQFKVAFDAWQATKPFTNPNAPPGPQSMPQYKPTGEAEAAQLDEEADHLFEEGSHNVHTGDQYVRVMVILASVLFLVGISSHFPVRNVRFALIALGGFMLLFGFVEIVRLPVPH